MVFRSNELDLLILQNGKDGTPANSKYIWVKYSQNENGIPLTDDPTDAIYMGLSYNQESTVESDDPSDYTWIKIHGENGEDAYTVYLTNENVSFAIGYDDNKAIANQTYETEVKIFQGINERIDFTIGEINSANGITVDKNGHVITLSVNIGASITAEVGSFRIPINIDGLVFFKDITWSTSHQGAPGLQGEGALNVVVENESQMIACTNEGLVLENTLLSIPFSAYKGFDRIPCTVSVGVLPSGMTLGSNTPATAASSGEIILNVSKNATLGNAAITTGNIQLTFTIESQQFVRNFIWTKVKDGANGNTYSLELSTVILSRGFNNTLSPSVITMNAYQMVDGEQVPYNGRFIISQQTFNSYNLTDENGSILTDENGFLLFEADNGTGDYENVYVSAQNENEYVYDLSSQFISGMVVYLCEADNISRVLDQQTVVVLTNIDDIRPTITQIQTTMAGTVFQVDNINNQIINKVWQSDVIESINNYDQTTVQEIRDQQSQMVIDIEGISTNVSDITSTFEDDIQTLNEKTSQMEQDAEGFKTEVSETYATKKELNNTSETLQSSIEQTAGQINQQITNLEGDISTNTQNIDSITQRVESAEGSITELEQTATDIQLEVGRKKDVFPAKVRYIRDWLGENNLDGEKCWTGISVIVNPTGEPDGDIDIAHGLTPTSDIAISGLSYYTDGNDETFVSTTETGMHYLQIDLNTKAFQDGYIIIKHANFVKKFLTDESSNILTDQSSNILYITENVSNRRYEHKLEVSEDGTRWYTLYDSEDSGEYTEEASGRTYFINDGYVQNNMAQLRVGLDGITLRVESAEGNITSINQSVSSINSQITNIQGDITSINQDIDGIETRVESSEGNITLLQQTSSELNTRITNNEGDISTLEQTAGTLQTQIQDAEGDISTLQQTASSLSTRVSTAEGDITSLEQSASSLATRVGNAEGDITTLEQTAQGLQVSVNTAQSTATNAQTAANNAAKTATNFLSYDSANGLLIGNRSSGSWSGFRTQITSSEFNILDASGNELASYGANTIELGKNNEDAVIELCNDNGSVEYAKNITVDNINGGTKQDDYLRVHAVNSMLSSTNGEAMVHYDGRRDGANEDLKYVRSFVNASKYGVYIKSASSPAGIGYTNESSDIQVRDNGLMMNTTGQINMNCEDIFNIVARGTISLETIERQYNIVLNGHVYGQNDILWSGAWYMNASQTANLNNSISNQAHGIVLIFNQWNTSSNTTTTSSWHSFFIPKYATTIGSGYPWDFWMGASNFGHICGKALYIYDDHLTGADVNAQSGSANGVTYTNTSYVMRYVLGI